MAKLKTIIADFKTQLSAKIAIGETIGTIQNNVDDDGVVLPNGEYCFTLDSNNAQKEHIICTLTGKNLTNIKSVSRQGAETTGVAREHRINATVAITDFSHILMQNKLLSGVTGLDATSPLVYDAVPVFSDEKELITKGYADAISSAGITSMLVSDNGGVEININTGTYILNGEIKTYAGVSGKELTDDATNYIQILDGALNIATDAFDNDAIPLATVICASGDITSLVDNRPFYTGMDIIANYGIGRSTSGIFIDLATNPGLQFTGGKLDSKLKTAGGLSKDTDGIYISSLPSGADGSGLINLNQALSSFVSVPYDTLQTSDDNFEVIPETQTSLTKQKEILFNDCSGVVRVKFTIVGDSSNNKTAFGRIYKNGVAHGTLRNSVSGAEFSEDLAFDTGDLIQIYVSMVGGGNPGSLENFRLYYGKIAKPLTNTVNAV